MTFKRVITLLGITLMQIPCHVSAVEKSEEHNLVSPAQALYNGAPGETFSSPQTYVEKHPQLVFLIKNNQISENDLSTNILLCDAIYMTIGKDFRYLIKNGVITKKVLESFPDPRDYCFLSKLIERENMIALEELFNANLINYEDIHNALDRKDFYGGCVRRASFSRLFQDKFKGLFSITLPHTKPSCYPIRDEGFHEIRKEQGIT